MIEPHLSRTFAIGDVHGCATALEVLLQQLAPTNSDRLILLGDVIDRGPHSSRVVEVLLDLRQSCRLELIMGNHEEMLLDAIRDPRLARFWLDCGGVPTLNSYAGSLENMPDEHLEFLSRASPYVETSTEILVHANLEPGVELEQQTPQWLRWQKLTGWELPHASGKRIICGHTEMPGVPHVSDGWVMLDTAAYRGGFLTALDLNSGEIIQASQRGERRSGVRLDEL